MGSTATARSAPTGEHHKARYRLLVFGLLALLGPPAFGIEVGLFSALYSAALMLYALWALRLTVVFRDDASLGYLLTLFDVLMTLPLLVWGSAEWMAAPVAGLWVAGLSVSAVVQRRHRLAALLDVPGLVDPITGFRTARYFEVAVSGERALSEERARPFALISVRMLRFADLTSYCGSDATDRVASCLARRAAREVGAGYEGFRLAHDHLALLIPSCSAVETTELAAAVSAAVCGKVIDGRRIECAVGYAVGPRDGATGAELVAAADASVLPQTYTASQIATSGSPSAGSSPLSRARVAVG